MLSDSIPQPTRHPSDPDFLLETKHKTQNSPLMPISHIKTKIPHIRWLNQWTRGMIFLTVSSNRFCNRPLTLSSHFSQVQQSDEKKGFFAKIKDLAKAVREQK